MFDRHLASPAIARWTFEHGANADGFGGHTALFGCVVSQAYRCGRQTDGAFTRLLLDRGANPNARASLRKRLHFTEVPERVRLSRDG